MRITSRRRKSRGRTEGEPAQEGTGGSEISGRGLAA